MARRGPKPTPTPILRLRQSRRAQNRTEGAGLAQNCPPCPKRFIMKQENEDGEAVRRVAKSTWHRLAHDLFKAGLFIDKDREMMQMLCDSFGRWVLACDKLDTEGHTIEGSAGSTVKSPWVGIRNDMWAQVCKAATCFGLSPADLAGVRAVQKPSTDEGKARFFKEA